MKRLAAVAVLAAALVTATPAAAQPTGAAGDCPATSMRWPAHRVLFAAYGDGVACQVELTVTCQAPDGRTWNIHRTRWVDNGEIGTWRIRCGRNNTAIARTIATYPR